MTYNYGAYVKPYINSEGKVDAQAIESAAADLSTDLKTNQGVNLTVNQLSNQFFSNLGSNQICKAPQVGVWSGVSAQAAASYSDNNSTNMTWGNNNSNNDHPNYQTANTWGRSCFSVNVYA